MHIKHVNRIFLHDSYDERGNENDEEETHITWAKHNERLLLIHCLQFPCRSFVSIMLWRVSRQICVYVSISSVFLWWSQSVVIVFECVFSLQIHMSHLREPCVLGSAVCTSAVSDVSHLRDLGKNTHLYTRHLMHCTCNILRRTLQSSNPFFSPVHFVVHFGSVCILNTAQRITMMNKQLLDTCQSWIRAFGPVFVLS